MISDDEVEAALDYLRKNGPTAAKARAELTYMVEYRKTLKALLMKDHLDKPLAAQEREAYADPRYLEHLNALKTAVYNNVLQDWGRTAAEAKIEAWRTQQANERSIGRIG